jgi:cytidylate kinase
MTAENAENERKCQRPLIAVVGPCAAGKSSLVKGLKARGYNARCVAQDHSYVPDMWQRITNPDLLIYLDAEWNTIARRRRISWTERYLNDERHRLCHARQHCDLYLRTDDLTAEEVLQRVLTFLDAQTP